MTADQTRSILSDALCATPALSEHIDEDTSEYLISILIDDPADDDAREAVSGFIQSSIEDENVEDVCAQFFALLDASLSNDGGVISNNNAGNSSATADDHPRKLTNAITLKTHDIQSFASGLVAETDSSFGMSDDPDAQSEIQSFYANMIDVSNHPRAKSERERRKARQKEMRERLEDEERQRAIEDSMRMMEEDVIGRSNNNNDGVAEISEEMAEISTAADNSADVHLTNFNLPNRKGGGPDLLNDANLILASGRRYGLMGRNGCGKTTLLTALSERQLNDGAGGGVPKKMSMLLVRQEIMGNELSAVETVLKSDVRREGVKRWIEHVENELNKLDNPETSCEGSNDVDEKEQQKSQPPSKGKQRLKDRKKNKAVSAASAKKAETKNKSNKASSSESIDDKRKQLNAKLGLAYERLARIEQEEGGDPEPRARKVLFGLGFTTPEMQDKPTSELSGGWRMRVSLSCALFADPALLL